MKEKFINHVILLLNKNRQYTNLDNIKFKYALQMIYTTVTKVTVILLISLLLNTLKETLLLMLFYSVLRGFAFGIHAKNNIYCWIISLLTYGVVPLMIKYFVFPIWAKILMSIICFILLALFAPADTPKKPMLHQKGRHANKIAVIIVALICISLLFLVRITIFQNAIIFALVIQSICVCPLTYKIFHVPYNNYKYYKKKTV